MHDDHGGLRLGELLLQRGLISSADLHQALTRQITHGGRIGSNLVELERVSLDTIANVLGLQLHVPVADLAAPNPPNEALRLLPAEICQKFGIVPLRLEGSTLHLAMQDPGRLDLISRLSELLRLHVQRYVVPQLRLLYLLERSFGLTRPSRYLRETVASITDDRRRYLQATVHLDGEVLRSPTGTKRGWAAVSDLAQPPGYRAAFADESWVSLDERDIRALQLSSAVSGCGWDDVFVERTTTEQALDELRHAATRADVVSTLIKPILPATTLSTLLLPRGELAVALAASGTVYTSAQLRRLVVPLTTPSLLQRAISEHRVVSSAAAEDPLQELLASFLGAPMPAHAYVAPIVLAGKVVNVLCIQTATPANPESTATLARLAEAAGAAYAALIMAGRERDASAAPTDQPPRR